MKRKIASLFFCGILSCSIITGCTNSNDIGEDGSKMASVDNKEASSDEEATDVDNKEASSDKEAADNVAKLIDDIYVQKRNENTDKQCEEAKKAWDMLTDTQKELVEGENADPDYFGKDTGDSSKDNPLNDDEIGENELLVVSFGTSFNDSRVADIKSIEDALISAYENPLSAAPQWSVRRAFTSQIIINHIQARDNEKIDNVEQAMERAVKNNVKKLVIQPTHLMYGAEFDELYNVVENYKDKIEKIEIAEPLLGKVGSDATETNNDKEAVANGVVLEAVKTAGFESAEDAAKSSTAFVFMGHGTSHTAKVTYTQMQAQFEKLGHKNVFVGTVEGEPEGTSCEEVIEKVKNAGYKNVILRPLMVVAGDHANNDMAGDDEDSWTRMFMASGNFESIDTQISGLGSINDIQNVYIAHSKAAIDKISL